MTLDKDTTRKALESFNEMLELHEAHTWEQVGRCVYCADCGERLYQGYLPKERRPVRRAPATPQSTQEMRARWQKD
jgi:hypothetical protein